MPQIEGSQNLDFGKIRSVLTEILHARITQHFLGGSPFHEPNPITQRQIFVAKQGLGTLGSPSKKHFLGTFWYIWANLEISDSERLEFF